ncbi:unnamed protein product [Schistosoma mattheei]|uniref:Uncharacterized protein n=1 Tax=Schistosoma mattheei TaxID=31246 RepID=A0A183P4K1_9TREM|nr:unnamed protein product [Schistosoma mattheei]
MKNLKPLYQTHLHVRNEQNQTKELDNFLEHFHLLNIYYNRLKLILENN